MFNFFSILLLLTAVLQIAEAIQIWVKPSALQYKAEIICLNNDCPIKIGEAIHDSFFEEVGTNAYVNIGTDLSRCDHHIATVKVRITEIYCLRSDSMEFEIPKTELSTRRTAVVLAFNIEPSARKQFYFQQSSSSFGRSQRPLLDYELEIVCEYHLGPVMKELVFGSGVQFNGQNGINILIYEIEMLAFCSQGKIELSIYNAEREKTYIDVTREFLLENDAFNINMSNRTVQPISQRRTENVLSRTIIPSSTIPSGASSSTTRQAESSTLATAQTLRPSPQTESNYECVVCCVRQERPEIAFVPCGHVCACRKCSEEIIEKKITCPKCQQKIEELLRIYP